MAVLALDGVVAFDLATPLETFGRTRLADGRPAYRLVTVAPSPEVDAGPFTLRAARGLDALAEADTIMLPGLVDFRAPVPDEVLDALREAARFGTRIASVCVGAFVLSATGLLDGQRATTHWAASNELARRHPAVDVDPAVLYVDNGQLLTSAGAAAGLDLCLHMIRRDHGSSVAADTARLSVMPLERAGGQAQFITHAPPVADSASLASLLSWLEVNSARDLDLAAIAAQARVSVRTLSRHFVEQTGTTPLAWLHRTRLSRAQHLLETTSQPIERIARQVGFASPTTFRDRFRALVGVSPQAYRQAFRAPTSEGAPPAAGTSRRPTAGRGHQ